MSENDNNIEELENEIDTEAAEDEDDSLALGESLYNALKEENLVDDPWDDVSVEEKKKYQNTAVCCGM